MWCAQFILARNSQSRRCVNVELWGGGYVAVIGARRPTGAVVQDAIYKGSYEWGFELRYSGYLPDMTPEDAAKFERVEDEWRYCRGCSVGPHDEVDSEVEAAVEAARAQFWSGACAEAVGPPARRYTEDEFANVLLGRRSGGIVLVGPDLAARPLSDDARPIKPQARLIIEGQNDELERVWTERVFGPDVDGKPTPAHAAVARLCHVLGLACVTANPDPLLELAGAVPLRPMSPPKSLLCELPRTRGDAAPVLVCVGMDRLGRHPLVESFRHWVPNGRVMVVGNTAPPDLSCGDALLLADPDIVLPKIVRAL